MPENKQSETCKFKQTHDMISPQKKAFMQSENI